MDRKSLILVLSVLLPVITYGWRSSLEEDRRDLRRVHYHQKRHMLPPDPEVPSPREKKRSTTSKPREVRKKVSTSPKPRDIRKKPSGHLTPLEEDDIENDEVVSVAIGPPPIRPKYEKAHKNKAPIKKTLTNNNVQTNNAATNLVKDVLSQLGRELLTKDVNENFVFGQYVGNSMKNMTSEQRISLQHEILELIVKYQKKEKAEPQEKYTTTPTMKEMKIERKYTSPNETDENWPDFSNLEKIVG